DLLPGADVINFSIGATGSQQTISPVSALPAITDPVFLDGWSQGAAGYMGPPLIQLDGAGAGFLTTGLSIQTPDSTVRGLVIDNFSGHGLDITGSGATGNLVTG